MSKTSQAAMAIVVSVVLLTANQAAASHRTAHQASRSEPATQVYNSQSLGNQPFANPDRDFSIENLRSHPSQYRANYPKKHHRPQ
jgi:hypothetical protein